MEMEILQAKIFEDRFKNVLYKTKFVRKPALSWILDKFYVLVPY